VDSPYANTTLTASKADRQIKSLKSELERLLPKGAKLAPAPDGTDKPTALGVQCGDPNSADLRAPTQYNYGYEVQGVSSRAQFPAIADRVFNHFARKSGWTVDDKASNSDWDLRSPGDYLVSLVISPDGDLLSITLSTPCVPKSSQTFMP